MFLLGWSRIFARSRRFMRIAARLDLALDIASLAAGAQEVLEAIVVRLEFIVSHSPVLNGQIRVEKVFAVAFASAGCEFEVICLKAVRLAIPVHHGAAESGSG